MTTYRRTAVVVGVLFIAAIVMLSSEKPSTHPSWMNRTTSTTQIFGLGGSSAVTGHHHPGAE